MTRNCISPGSALFCASLVLISALLCTACGKGDPANPYTISGQIFLNLYPDGGSSVGVLAVVNRTLDDGGAELVLDAGVALNEVSLGDSQLADEQSWLLPAVANAIPDNYQVLSVIGANPPADVELTCPQTFAITSPAENAVFPVASDVTVQWASTDGSATAPVEFGINVFPDNPPQQSGQGGTTFKYLDAGTTAYDLAPASLGIDGGANFTVSVAVAGDSPDMFSACYVAPSIDFRVQ